VLIQVNNLSEAAALTKGARIIVPPILVECGFIARRVEQALICSVKAQVRR
jgi:hypothetical protein